MCLSVAFVDNKKRKRKKKERKKKKHRQVSRVAAQLKTNNSCSMNLLSWVCTARRPGSSRLSLSLRGSIYCWVNTWRMIYPAKTTETTDSTHCNVLASAPSVQLLRQPASVSPVSRHTSRHHSSCAVLLCENLILVPPSHFNVPILFSSTHLARIASTIFAFSKLF